MLSMYDLENEESKKNIKNLGLAFEDESDISESNEIEKVNNEDILKSDSVNFSSLIELLDEPDSVIDTNFSLPESNTNNSLLYSINNKENKITNENEYSTLKVPILKTYSKRINKIPFSFEDENDNDSDNDIITESENFTFYGKSKYNRDNLNINTAYSFPKRDKLDEKLLNVNINDFIRKEDILENNNNKFNNNIEKMQEDIEDSQIKDHIMKTIEMIKNNDNNNNILNLKETSEDFVATQKLDSSQVISQDEFGRLDILKSSQLDNNFNNLSLEKEKEQILLNNKISDIQEDKLNIFDNEILVIQPVKNVIEKHENRTMQDNSKQNNIYYEDLTNKNDSDKDYDFNKNFEIINDNNKKDDLINEKEILNFDEWKNEYFSTSGLNTKEM
eukprot:jgi/Orpsp1_1/1175952/evm.model.c7180000055851.2